MIKLFKENVDISLCEREAQIVTTISHPRIISGSNFYARMANPLRANKECAALVLEYAPNGDLLQLLTTVGHLPEIVACTYFQQLVGALEQLHSASVCHMDIKPENIFLDQNYSIKLGDFGLAFQSTKSGSLKGTAGTTQYFAPEMHENKIYNAYQADLFALGVTLFTMVSGNLPFLEARSTDRFYRMLMEKRYSDFWAFHERLMKRKQQYISSDFRELIEKMLHPNPKKRFTLEQIKQSSWYKGLTLSDEKLESFIKALLEKKATKEVSSSTSTTA